MLFFPLLMELPGTACTALQVQPLYKYHEFRGNSPHIFRSFPTTSSTHITVMNDLIRLKLKIKLRRRLRSVERANFHVDFPRGNAQDSEATGNVCERGGFGGLAAPRSVSVNVYVAVSVSLNVTGLEARLTVGCGAPHLVSANRIVFVSLARWRSWFLLRE